MSARISSKLSCSGARLGSEIGRAAGNLAALDAPVPLGQDGCKGFNAQIAIELKIVADLLSRHAVLRLS